MKNNVFWKLVDKYRKDMRKLGKDPGFEAAKEAVIKSLPDSERKTIGPNFSAAMKYQKDQM